MRQPLPLFTEVNPKTSVHVVFYGSSKKTAVKKELAVSVTATNDRPKVRYLYSLLWLHLLHLMRFPSGFALCMF